MTTGIMNIKIQMIPLLPPGEINWSFSMRLCRDKRNILHLFSYSVMSSLFVYHKLNWKVLANIFFICHTKLKCGGRITPSSTESSRFKYTNQRHATIFFSVKKKKKTVRRSKAKRKAKKVLDNSSIRQRYSYSVRFLEFFFFTFY